MMYIIKNKINVLLLIVAVLFTLAGCSKKNQRTPANVSHKVIFKAEASSGSFINMVVYGYDVTLTPVSGINTSTWSSPELTVPATANIASITANALGTNASATLKVQVYVNGVLKKEGTSTGTALSATAQFNLN